MNAGVSCCEQKDQKLRSPLDMNPDQIQILLQTFLLEYNLKLQNQPDLMDYLLYLSIFTPIWKFLFPTEN